ncbi:MAG: Fic family protein [Lentimicrobium sp.]|nr:Fic family protein [Lentimicrobium sp.]
MDKITHFSQDLPVFHGRQLPEPGKIVGYAALISVFDLKMCIPQSVALISKKNRQYENEQWKVLTPRHQPEETLHKQIVFALKYEGINLLFFKKLFEKLSVPEVLTLVSEEPTGQSSRKIWFLYEWLIKKQLPIKDLAIKNYVPLVDEKLQYVISDGYKSSRHRIINNLPGTLDFCPLIFKTPRLEKYINQNLAAQKDRYLTGIRKDLLQRASAFLMLKDSKASFAIEGESPKSKRAAHWGHAIGQAGARDLSQEELLRLQQIVIENPRFIETGYRKKGGFVGEHDRNTSEPLPDHISARHQDLEVLMNGLLNTEKLLFKSDMDAVLCATLLAFGFVFIHPFEDGNGRIHRYLIHHTLAKKQFSQQGIIFPVSSAILNKIDEYRKVLERYSLPLLDFIDWKETKDHNVEVLNETIDYYRYFDATSQAEFLYDCVNETIQHIIPDEVNYLTSYDEFKYRIEDEFEMPDRMIALLVKFLEQNHGVMSNRAKDKEFSCLSDEEIHKIEKIYAEAFKLE